MTTQEWEISSAAGEDPKLLPFAGDKVSASGKVETQSSTMRVSDRVYNNREKAEKFAARQKRFAIREGRADRLDRSR
jgi:hypothetical protein